MERIQDSHDLAKYNSFWEHDSKGNVIEVVVQKSAGKVLDCSVFADFPKLRKLTVSDVRLRKPWLDLSKHSKLEHLSLTKTGVTLTGISELLGCPKFFSLRLHEKNVTDKSLQEICQIRSLKRLELMHASIQDIEPISQLSKLEVLGLTLSKVDDDQIGVLSKCSSLHELQLEGTQISEHGLKKLACLPNLRELAIQNTNISSAVYEVLSKFCSLEQIYVDQEIEESTIKHLRKLKNLKRIYCGDTINQEHQAILRRRLGIDVY